ncbi:MAG: hypothetical protein VX000_07470, partial [Myxococcota bacterium]|nr:hypothetical protein [Myxococcota bacterium]
AAGFNSVEVRIRQRVGLVYSWVDVRAGGVAVLVDGRQFTDRSRSPTPVQRRRKLDLVGLQARWERDEMASMLAGTGGGIAGIPAVLTLQRPGRPDIYLPGLLASDLDLETLCNALARAADAAGELVGLGRAEVPDSLRSLIADVE